MRKALMNLHYLYGLENEYLKCLKTQRKINIYTYENYSVWRK